MNDRHPSGTVSTPAPASSDAASAPHAPYGTQEAPYDGFTTYGGYGTGDGSLGGHGTTAYATDPLFGSLPADATGTYDGGQWSTGAQHVFQQHPYTAHQYAGYDSGAYHTTAWTADQQQLPTVPAQYAAPDVSGQWDASAWLQPDQTVTADPTQQWQWGTQVHDTGAYDATRWNGDGTAQHTGPESYEQHAGAEPYEQHPDVFDQQATATFETVPDAGAGPAHEQSGHDGAPSDGTGASPAADEDGTPLLDDQEEVTASPSPRAASRGARGRRRTPTKRSALLTVAVPSVCVLGVAGIAAASVGTFTGGSTDTAAAPEAQAVKPSAANNKLDSQLQSLSADADAFAARASRTQQRIDLKEQREAERKKAAEEAARKERLRPKFALPVARHGLSAYFGQAGINWMSVHTGIDFPVAYGTTVMAATDGVVSTKWNSAYGNMMIVTAKDGTQTWYCHLSHYRVAPGTTVKAGDPIAYSGNSGNSTGPHLHFEVRPYGGSAVDPLPWLRSHDLDPT
ncbi:MULTISPECIES: M23 family metallopeptidase [unclassified Streptomyces]|uniref:M23 family metallopeptidase n=1 Tax=unclassified Streptomyces TaxID=2593676 RepID=UPI001F0420F6|nr:MULTISPECIES: M23 family metallopeptidase [unclassified Streptomyces]MCH0563963.1 M23 family metallopeptidase [Streptomyces sp. MUM 2J]MCH0570730.1 M23 family metallopeptidase [Streptomyces sp. MUM 136J]